MSDELKRWKKVIEKTEKMFTEIDKMGVNLISVVTDSASSYAAARYLHGMCLFFFNFLYTVDPLYNHTLRDHQMV